MRLLSPLIFLLFSACVYAQNLEEGEKIAPDRPGFGDAVSVVPQGTMHIETGAWVQQDRTDSLTINGYGLNSTLFRIGLFQKTEFRVDYNFWNTRMPSIERSEIGLYPIRTGLKYHLLYNKRIRPAITFIGMQELPFTATKNFRPKHPNTDFQLSFANKMNDWFALCYNLGTVLNFADDRPLYYYALALEFTISGKTGCYFQARGSSQRLRTGINKFYAAYYSAFMESGLMYYPNHNMQLDISGGLQAAENAAGKNISLRHHTWFFVTAGFSWRFHIIRQKISEKTK